MHIWTHRGNPGPENTLEGFSQAWLDGIRHFETDVHCTRDGILVLAHDSDISRLCGESKDIKDLSLAELREYKIGGKYNWTTLDELHGNFKPDRISLDLKSPEALAPFLAWAEDKNLENYVVGSFSARRVAQVRSALPRLTTALTSQEILMIISGLGFTLTKHAATRVAMVPSTFKGVKVLNRAFETFCVRNEIEIHVWTVNSREHLEEISHVKVDGIITDSYRIFM